MGTKAQEPNFSQVQLCSDIVKITLSGLKNNAAQDLVQWILQYAEFTKNIGVRNIPVIQDEKRTQRELNAIAARKVVKFKVTYYQSRARTTARQFILSILTSFTFSL